jgi:hypothetical protein
MQENIAQFTCCETHFATNALVLIVPFFGRMHKRFLTLLQLPCERLELLDGTNILKPQSQLTSVCAKLAIHSGTAVPHLLVMGTPRFVHL